MAKKENALLKWPVIALAMVLVWPVGVALVALKFLTLRREFAGKAMLPEAVVPFKDEKTTAQIKIYRNHLNSQKRKRNTALATMVIGLLVGSVGMTMTWMDVFSSGFSTMQAKPGYVLFTLVGIMQGMSAYQLLREKRQLAQLAAIIDERRVVTEAELAQDSGMSTAEVRTCLQTMFDRCYFADGVHADEAAGTFVCYGK